MRRLAVFVGLWLLAAGVQAQEDRGPYVGVGAGVFGYEESDDDFGVIFDDTATSYRLLGGYQINEGLGIELSFGRTGDVKESYVLGPGDSLDVKIEYDVAALRAVGIVPLDRIDFFGGVGYYEATGKATISSTLSGVLEEFEDDDSGATLIGGLQFYLDEVTLRVEYQWFDTESDVTVWDLGVSVLFHF